MSTEDYAVQLTNKTQNKSRKVILRESAYI